MATAFICRTLFSPKKVNYSHEETMNTPEQPREMSEHDAIEQAWRDYHGPIKAEGEEDYFPALPPLFKRGFLYGVEYAKRDRDEARKIAEFAMLEADRLRPRHSTH